MELKGRLKLIAEKVPNCNVVCDIGTDHAYIPIYLIEKKVCNKAIASDIKRGPVKVANENIIKAGLGKLIDTRLGEGLKTIDINEADVIVIAGMGGILIKDILLQDIEKSKNAKALILQPMNAVEILREWLYKNGFNIYDEGLAGEEDKLYVVISANWTGYSTEHEEIDYYIGRELVENRDPLLFKYINKKLRQLKKIICEIENSSTGNEEIKNKYKKMKNNLCKIMEELKEENIT